MELLIELLLTAAVSLLIAFLIGKFSGAGGLDRTPAEAPAATSGPGVEQAVLVVGEPSASDSIQDEQVRVHEVGGAGEVYEIREESVSYSRRAAEALRSESSDRIEANDVSDEGLHDEEKPLEGEVEKRIREERSEAHDARLEFASAEKIRENDDVLTVDRVEAETIARSPEENEEIRREKESSSDEEDEWEGIERSELEKLFGEATAYVGGAAGADAVSKLSNDVQMQLYGLQKIATEGPCYEPQPMALKLTARVKWYAWQRLGNMNPEEAMEQYITLLSHSVPEWIGEKPIGERDDRLEEEVSGKTRPVPCSSLHRQLSSKTERESEGPSFIEDHNVSSGPRHTDRGHTKTLFLNLVFPATMRYSGV